MNSQRRNAGIRHVVTHVKQLQISNGNGLHPRYVYCFSLFALRMIPCVRRNCLRLGASAPGVVRHCCKLNAGTCGVAQHNIYAITVGDKLANQVGAGLQAQQTTPGITATQVFVPSLRQRRSQTAPAREWLHSQKLCGIDRFKPKFRQRLKRSLGMANPRRGQ